MAKPLVQSRLLPGSRAEKIRVRPDTRDGLRMVRLDLLEPVAKHTDAMTVVGRAIFIPLVQVEQLRAALAAAAVEAGTEARADVGGEF